MKSAALILVLCLSTVAIGASGCVLARSEQAQNDVNYSLNVAQKTILETTKLVERCHDSALITDAKYAQLVGNIMSAVVRYNAALRLDDGPTAQDVELLLSDLEKIREKL